MPLCSKIVEALQSRQENFHIQTLCVLRHNTVRASGGDAHPIVSGFMVCIFYNCFLLLGYATRFLLQCRFKVLIPLLMCLLSSKLPLDQSDLPVLIEAQGAQMK